MWSCIYAFVFGITNICLAVPNSRAYVLHEQRVESAEWTRLQSLNQDDLLPIRIGLAQTNLDKGYELLMNVSDPDSPHYAQYYTQDEVTQLFSPSNETLSAVSEWLQSASIAMERLTHSDNHGWYAFDATVSEAESLLGAKFHLFEHLETGHRNVATNSYYIPSHLVGHIDYILPGVRLYAPQKKSPAVVRDLEPRAAALPHWPSTIYGGKNITNNTNPFAYCDTEITPACIRALYDIPLPESLYGGKPQRNNALGIYEYGDVYLQENLDKFFRNYTPWIPQGTHPTPAFVDGAKARGPRFWDFGESDLDFVLAYPLIYPQQITLFQTDDSHRSRSSRYGDGIFNDFLDAIDGSYCTYKAYGETGNDPKIDPQYPDKHQHGYKGKLQCGVFKPPPVLSLSYGEQEADLPIYYQKRQCNEFMKLALQGISVIFSSGDNGVAGRPNGKNTCLGASNKIFSPTYPVNCPYITAVGATKLPKGRTVADREVAPYDPNHGQYSSGGGFSNIYPTPAYQATAVHTYLTQHRPPYKSYMGPGSLGAGKGVFNRLGRGIPDVSANGDNTVVYTRGRWQLSGGTSAAAPIFASVLNRINEKRLAAGKATLGFVNTALYKNPGLLNDIVEGHNPGCGTEGFRASQGWDPVTGLGTPSFKRMLEFFMQLQ